MSIRYLAPRQPQGDTTAPKILSTIKKEFGAAVEPFTRHLPQPELLAGIRMTCRGAVERVGASALSVEVRHVVIQAVEKWNGSDPGISSGWCEDASQGLSAPDRTPAKLALLTALAPYRVDQSLVKAFSASFPGDRNLLSALAWSSFKAARKVGTWL